jgi:hypothetical protein
MILVAIIWLVLTFVIGVAAERRGRSGFGWFLLALFLSPLIAGILLAAFPDKNLRALLEEPRRSAAVDDEQLQRNVERDRNALSPGDRRLVRARPLMTVALLFGVAVLIVFLFNGKSNQQAKLDLYAPHTAGGAAVQTGTKVKSAVIKPPPAVSPRAAESVIVALDGSRGGDQLIVTGKTQGLPPGTKLWVEITRLPGHAPSTNGGPMDDHVFVADDGTFKATISKPDRASFPAGTYDIKITSIFNSAWQSVDVLKRAGVQLDNRGRSDLVTNPTAIPASPDFKPDDPEFPKATRHLEAIRKITVGALPSDVAAIDGVKDAILVVEGRGRSSLSVAKSVDFFVSAGGFKAVGWSAAIGSDGKWIVTLDCVDAENPKKAKWQYDPKTKAVKYLDPLSKLLSYVPPD